MADMRIGIVGGKLQGTEIAYLAREAGYETTLVDKDPRAPAAGLVDTFFSFDVADRARLQETLSAVDLVFPALENTEILKVLLGMAVRTGTPLVLDLNAYTLSASKLRSSRLFDELGVPTPRPFPGCDFPVIAKPCFGSGSEGISVFTQRSELDSFLATRQPEHWCVQEFVDGPSYSVEVVGRPGNYQAVLVVELFMDESLDCKGVVTPACLRDDIESEFKRQAITLAEALSLNGIMDVEGILTGDTMFFLEVDARFPSQTPIAVYHATDINMVEMLADLFLRGETTRVSNRPVKQTTLEHVRVTSGHAEFAGEHLMTECGPLRVLTEFYGAETAITNYERHSDDWVATLINRSPKTA